MVSTTMSSSAKLDSLENNSRSYLLHNWIKKNHKNSTRLDLLFIRILMVFCAQLTQLYTFWLNSLLTYFALLFLCCGDGITHCCMTTVNILMSAKVIVISKTSNVNWTTTFHRPQSGKSLSKVTSNSAWQKSQAACTWMTSHCCHTDM